MNVICASSISFCLSTLQRAITITRLFVISKVPCLRSSPVLSATMYLYSQWGQLRPIRRMTAWKRCLLPLLVYWLVCTLEVRFGSRLYLGWSLVGYRRPTPAVIHCEEHLCDAEGNETSTFYAVQWVQSPCVVREIFSFHSLRLVLPFIVHYWKTF